MPLGPRGRAIVLAAALLAAVLLVAACSADSSRSTSGPVIVDEPTSSSSESGTTEESTDLILDVEFEPDRRIHVTCFGPVDPAVPTVLLEAGGGSPSDTWDLVVDALSPTRRTCSYDRAGVGASPTAPESRRTNKQLVADLEATLAGAGIEGPFVLVGHSLAVWPLTVYAAAHPDDVAGVVLVDPRGPRVSARSLAALPPQRDDEPEVIRVWREEDLGAFEHDPSLNPEHLDLARMSREAGALLNPAGPFFGDVPLIVLSASGTNAAALSDLPPVLRQRFGRIWLQEQRALAEESTSGTFIEVAPSGHEIQVDQPQAVVDAIESVLADITG